MAEELTMTIGPSGQPPVTTYTYDSGSVSLAPRAAVSHSMFELRTVVARIDAFCRAVRAGEPPTTALDPPMNYRYRKQNDAPTQILCEFRSGALQVEATIGVVTRIVDFAPRNDATVAWSDFELFAQWMTLLAEFVSRPTL